MISHAKQGTSMLLKRVSFAEACLLGITPSVIDYNLGRKLIKHFLVGQCFYTKLLHSGGVQGLLAAPIAVLSWVLWQEN